MIKNDNGKKMKISLKKKNSSKSKFKSINLIGSGDKSDKASPLPKSPEILLKSPSSSKSNLIKVKTSYKVKVSTEKTITSSTNPTIFKG